MHKPSYAPTHTSSWMYTDVCQHAEHNTEVYMHFTAHHWRKKYTHSRCIVSIKALPLISIVPCPPGDMGQFFSFFFYPSVLILYLLSAAAYPLSCTYSVARISLYSCDWFNYQYSTNKWLYMRFKRHTLRKSRLAVFILRYFHDNSQDEKNYDGLYAFHVCSTGCCAKAWAE